MTAWARSGSRSASLRSGHAGWCSSIRTAIRVAQRALCELRDEPELARFLDAGATATDLPEVHQACTRIDLVLGLQVDSEAGRVTGRKQRRSTPNGVPERP